MAAYASLVSLEHIINNLQHHSRPPITLHKEQSYLLTEKVTFLQEFLQVYNLNLDYSKEADPLESRIAHAAYAAEDAIESHILDRFTNNDGEKMSSDGLYQDLEKVIEDMALIEKEAMEIKETVVFQNQLHTKSAAPADSSRSSSSSIEQKKIMMVGADDLLLQLKDKLTSNAHDLQIVPVVGMGGSGKTTLALNIYQDGLIKEHFHTCAWVTISQEYNIQEILLQLLTQLIEKPNQGLGEVQLGEMLHKHLYGKKYIIILDDMWSLKAWDGVKKSLPDNKKGSRIVITTRLTDLASALPNSNRLVMKLLDDGGSWDLLFKTVFGEKGCCPYEFEEIGKNIGKSCKGLPLSIVVVGGLLAKSKQSIETWVEMEKNLNAIVNLEDDERCLKTLHMSYKHLPVHLKPCFLYMGIYREDEEILISKLIKLWVAEGFVKPVSGKRPEDVARVYLKDLIDRNLILIHKLGSIGSIKECKVHDLFRDLCIREAQKERLYTACVGQDINYRGSRIVLSNPLVDNVHQLVNSRFFTFNVRDTEFPSLVWQFWNLHALIVSQFKYKGFTAPNDIWYMSHIRHLYFNDLCLPDSPNVQDGIVLENIQTLATIRDFMCSKQVAKRIPNIRKLKIVYGEVVDDERFCLTDLDCLDKLESFSCSFKRPMCQMNYPQSLKKLSLRVHISQCWQDILDKIGDLPLLEKLKLYGGTFKGQWETTGGQFSSLKFLSLSWCQDLQFWTSEASHFKKLEQLHLYRLSNLEEIPLDFADISTLEVIAIHKCCDSAIESAYIILEENKKFNGEETTLQIQVKLSVNNDPALESFKSPNFHVTWLPY